MRRKDDAFAPAFALAGLAVALPAMLADAVPNVWYRMALGAIVLSTIALTCVDVAWRELFRPTARHIVLGVGAAVVLYLAGAIVARLLAAAPVLAAQMNALYAWKHAVPRTIAVPLLLLIVLGEEIVWRNAVTIPFADRLGPSRGTLAAAAAFALAHLSLGVPVLLAAALGAGAFWSALVVRTRSAIPALVSHALWDVAVLFWLPYMRG